MPHFARAAEICNKFPISFVVTTNTIGNALIVDVRASHDYIYANLHPTGISLKPREDPDRVPHTHTHAHADIAHAMQRGLRHALSTNATTLRCVGSKGCCLIYADNCACGCNSKYDAHIVTKAEAEQPLIAPKGGFGGLAGGYIKQTALANVRQLSQRLKPEIQVVVR